MFRQTAPKPLILACMPFDPNFDDVYQLAIKNAGEQAGGTVVRLDERMGKENILERLYTEIARANIIIADMSDNNPNVFYEIGYAHALNKVVLLLAQENDEIPFDLKHHMHLRYARNNLSLLREKLVKQVQWAIEESRTRGEIVMKVPFSVYVGRIAPAFEARQGNPVTYQTRRNQPRALVTLLLRTGLRGLPSGIKKVYCSAAQDSAILPSSLECDILEVESPDSDDKSREYDLGFSSEPIPPRATLKFPYWFAATAAPSSKTTTLSASLKLWFCTDEHAYEFPLELRFILCDKLTTENTSYQLLS